MQENGLDLIDKKTIERVDAFKKYSIFLVMTADILNFSLREGSFPATINDPRGDQCEIAQVKIRSHREYIEIAREAVIEATKRFNLPRIYISDEGQILNPAKGKGRVIG